MQSRLVAGNSALIFDSNFYSFLARTTLVFLIIVAFQECIDGIDLNLGNSTDHYANCSINGETYYDNDCTNFIKRIITWMGFGLVIFVFLICGCLWYCICFLCQALFCRERYEPTMFVRQYPNYSTIP